MCPCVCVCVGFRNVRDSFLFTLEADEEGPVQITVAQTSAVTSAKPSMNRDQEHTEAAKAAVLTPGGDKQLSQNNQGWWLFICC